MIHTGLVGWPLGHSLSPMIHNLAFKMAGIEGNYKLLPILPTDTTGLAVIRSDLRNGVLLGVNVTIPHKVAMAKWVDELTPIAERIGAVNTVYSLNGRILGTNTDSPGFLHDITRRFGVHCFEQGNALIFGAGGSARAVIDAMLGQGIQLVIAARDPKKAQEALIGLNTAETVKIINIRDVNSELLKKFGLFINTTPLGMTPRIENSPISKDTHFPVGGYVYDLVYNPRETVLFHQALSDGCQAATGFGMLVEQALIAFEIWTGVETNRVEFYARWSAMEENR